MSNRVVITIAIDVPEGASIQHSTSPVPSKPAAVPPAAGDGGHCPKHGTPWEHKSGTSREGKPYDFWGCPVKDDDGYCKARPAKGWTPPPEPPAPSFDDLPF